MKHEGVGNNQYIIQSGEGNSSSNTTFAVYIDNNDQFRVRYGDGSSNEYLTYDTGSSGGDEVTDNLWHHWIVNFEKSDKIKIYADGNTTAKATSGSISAFGNLSTTVGLKIGSIYSGAGNFFKGKLDEVRLYSKILSNPEIIKNYKHGKGKHKN